MHNPIQTFLQTEINTMPTSKYSVFLFLLGFLVPASQESPTYTAHYCTNSTTYQRNSKFEANLNLSLSTLSHNASLGTNFHRTRTGSGSPNVVNGLFLCRGDILAATCSECVTVAAKEIKQRCPVQKEAIIWYEVCMVRYSNQSMNNIVPDVEMADNKTIASSDRDHFNELLANLLNSLARKAAYSEANKFATEEAKFTSTETLYGLVQCTPELTTFDCNMCLRSAIAFVPTCCYGKQGARFLLPGCNVRYELYPFYNSTMIAQPRTSGKRVLAFVIPIVLSAALFVLGLCSFVGRQARNMKLASKKEDFVQMEVILKLKRVLAS